jgi:uncharacterized protein DUF2382
MSRPRFMTKTTAMRGRSFADETVEITLVPEHVEVTKRVMRGERIRLPRPTITDHRPVGATVHEEARHGRDRLIDADRIPSCRARWPSMPGI